MIFARPQILEHLRSMSYGMRHILVVILSCLLISLPIQDNTSTKQVNLSKDSDQRGSAKTPNSVEPASPSKKQLFEKILFEIEENKLTIKDACAKHNVKQSTFKTWKGKGGAPVDTVHKNGRGIFTTEQEGKIVNYSVQ